MGIFAARYRAIPCAGLTAHHAALRLLNNTAPARRDFQVQLPGAYYRFRGKAIAVRPNCPGSGKLMRAESPRRFSAPPRARRSAWFLRITGVVPQAMLAEETSVIGHFPLSLAQPSPKSVF